MALVLARFTDVLSSSDGTLYTARACGRPAGHVWEAWIEFVPVRGGHVLRTERETTQPNFQDALYWATGLSELYLQGALERAERPSIPLPAPVREETPAYDAPRRAVLDPFSVHAKGEELLRSELGALGRRHLLAIIEDYGLHPIDHPELAVLSDAALVEMIVAGVKARTRRAA